jgi:tetratricopeptide (TPR) repeat protein
MKRVAVMIAVMLVAAAWFGLAGVEPVRAQQVSPPQDYTPPPPQPEKTLTPLEEEEMRADLLMARKRFSEAVEAYQAIQKKMPKNDPRMAVVLNKIGIAYHQLLKLNEAKRYYDKAIKADKTYAPAYNNVGTVNYNRKRYGAAIKAYKKALELREDNATVHSNLGYAYFAQKKYEEAFLCFHRAVSLDPGVFEQRGSGAGSLLQDRTVEDRRLFFFFLAKAFASQSNAERTAFYLKKALDEGYNLAAVTKDPAFVSVVNDPQVQTVLRAAGIVPPAPKVPPPQL